jgi:predicted ferric reductase
MYIGISVLGLILLIVLLVILLWGGFRQRLAFDPSPVSHRANGGDTPQSKEVYFGMALWLWILIIVLIILVLFGGVGYRRW